MNKSDIGKALLRKRESLGYTRTKVARELTMRYGAVTQTAQIKRLEEASNAYTIGLLLKLCDYYGLSIEIK